MKRLVAALSLLMLALPSPAMAKGQFHPENEFELHPWVSIHIGPLDMSINKAVVYLLLGALVTILLAWFLLRFRLSSEPGKRQTVGEWVYDIAQVQVAEQGLPSKGMRLWFPYVFTLLLFIWTVNILGFIPLPLTGETWHGIPVWGIYAATSQLSVTLALAILTFTFTHVEGIRYNGGRRYFASWMPAGMPKFSVKWAIPLSLLYLLEIIGQFMRLLSLSVRLFANMLAGHILILTFIGLIFVAEQALTAIALVPIAAIFYLFEVLIVVSIQAFIFAALSAIYIGSAIEPQH